jgi:hypothetical protein
MIYGRQDVGVRNRKDERKQKIFLTVTSATGTGSLI